MFTTSVVRTLALLLLMTWVESAHLPCTQNCTTTPAGGGSGEVTPAEERASGGHGSLAWLVTPALFALGVFYVIYKCCRDGLCNCKRLRRRAAAMGEARESSSSSSSHHGYIPLSQVALYSTSQIPVAHPGVAGSTGTRRLLLVHNRTYCVTVDTVPDGRGAGSRRILVQPLSPPSYEEALAQAGARQDGNVLTSPPQYTSAGPPCYSIAMGEISPTPALEDHLALETVLSALQTETADMPVAFAANRRRHRSAQDTHVRRERHRNLSAQERRLWSQSSENDSTEFRQRCFSFSALKDAFRRSSSDVQERVALLSTDNQDDSIFPSGDELTLPGPSSFSPLPTSDRSRCLKTAKRQAQQVSFEDRILEDSESNESIEHDNRKCNTVLSAIGAQLRQRHSSAPETNKSEQKRLRHSSGNT